jgi:hypothetical protein
VAATPTLERYDRHLAATADWLLRSVCSGEGSRAYATPVGVWSRAYPETTGYLIPTLLELSEQLDGYPGEDRALELGAWLLSIQDTGGWWNAGLHPPKRRSPSVFNTAQVLHGLVALHDLTGESRWLEAAVRAGRWLRGGLGPGGVWDEIDYRAAGTPSYYAFAAWPMLAVAQRADDAEIRAGALGVLDAIVARRLPNGAFAKWGFEPDKPAFTHTIAYTLQGLIESARLLDDWSRYGEPAEQGLVELARRAELSAGLLPGRLSDDWRPAASFVCLTGNAQSALCVLQWEERRADLRLVNAAARLVDAVCDAQRLRGPGAVRGAVAGSSPLRGRYMALRYPNWAAKFHCEALLRLRNRLGTEWTRRQR